MTVPLPDFIVIGAAKSATTSLHWWLNDQPDIFMSTKKEPGFFAHRWHQGLEWYTGLFEPAPRGTLRGESSTPYTQPLYSEVAAQRMRELLPTVKLIYVVRHPIDRLLSHYRDRYRRARVRGPLAEVLQEPEGLILGTSLYYERLEPYIQRFDRHQILVVRFDDLVGDDPVGWNAVIEHLGLPPRPRPNGVRNETATQRQRSWILRRILDVRRRWPVQTPTWLRPVTRTIGRWSERRYRDPLRGETPEVPAAMSQAIWDDVARLEAWLGMDRPLWERPVLARGD